MDLLFRFASCYNELSRGEYQDDDFRLVHPVDCAGELLRARKVAVFGLLSLKTKPGNDFGLYSMFMNTFIMERRSMFVPREDVATTFCISALFISCHWRTSPLKTYERTLRDFNFPCCARFPMFIAP